MKIKYVFTHIIILLSLLMIVEALETPKIYELDLQFTNEILSLNTVKSTYGFLPDRINMPATGYRLELISVDNIILYTYIIITFNTNIILNPIH